ncbi:MAG: hypothetical protein Kow0092_29070 [Deferrisomatales bacterium]
MEWQVRVRDRVIRRFRLGDGEAVVLGRGADAEVRLDNPAVSRRHARLRREGERYILTDLGSTNGTSVNGRTVAGSVLVGPGERIALGKFVLAAVPDPAAAPAGLPSDLDATVCVAPLQAPAPVAPPFPRIEALRGRVRPEELSLEGRSVLTIGSHSGADLKVGGWLVARTQCSIHAREGRYYLIHHGGPRRTTLNGQRVRGECRLIRGDTVGVASARLRFR